MPYFVVPLDISHTLNLLSSGPELGDTKFLAQPRPGDMEAGTRYWVHLAPRALPSAFVDDYPDRFAEADKFITEALSKSAFEVYSRKEIDDSVMATLKALPSELVSDSVLGEVTKKLDVKLSEIEKAKVELLSLQERIIANIQTEVHRLTDEAVETIRKAK